MLLTILLMKPSRCRFTGKPGDPSPPIFEQIFKNARFAQGGNAIFEGCVRGNPKPTVSWTHKSVPLLESRKIRMSYDDNTGVVTLQINQIGPGDEGEYTCSAKNQYGERVVCEEKLTQIFNFGKTKRRGKLTLFHAFQAKRSVLFTYNPRDSVLRRNKWRTVIRRNLHRASNRANRGCRPEVNSSSNEATSKR